MKVCTDACLFGAWIAEKVASLKIEPARILDIGTGTGLLSLMVAQATNQSKIDAIEIDADAAKQAIDNIAKSPWQSRIEVLTEDVHNLTGSCKFDLIISNPPFYENDLKSTDKVRNTALHSEALSLQTLLKSIATHLQQHGHFAVLLPYHRTDECIELANRQGFYLHEKILVKQTEKHSFFRTMMWFGGEPLKVNLETITIKEGSQYSARFIELLQEYYLHL